MKKKKGFTLIEMILVIALIVILTTVATSSLASYIKNARTVSSGAESHQNKYTVAKTAVDGLGHVVPLVGPIVTFNPDGGSEIGQIPATVGATISPPSAPTKSGYTFVAWYKDDACMTAWNFSSDTVAGDMTLYAKWDSASPTNKIISYNTYGGSSQSSTPGVVGSTISPPPTPTKSENSFIAWYKDSSYTTVWNFSSDTVTGDMTLHAKWNSTAPVSKIISYNTYGGSSQSSTPGVVGSTISPPPTPTKSGNSFVAWYKDSSYIAVWNFSSDTVTGDMTLHAKWNPTPCQITYDTQGGSTIGPGSAISGGLIVNPGSPTQTGVTFDGWYKEASCANVWNFSSDTVTGNMTLFAKWIGPSTLTGTYTQGSQWKEDKKYRTDYIVTINNTGTTTMTTWSVNIAVPTDATFIIGYEATYSATSGKITVTPPSWGKSIEPGASHTFHFHIDMVKQNNNVLTVTAN